MSSDNKKIALTFDVELWYEGKWQQPYINQKQKENDTSFETSIDRLLTLLKQKKALATFFVTSTVVKTFPEYVQKIGALGHEIGSHGIDHQKLTDTDPETYKMQFVAHIKEIETLTGKKVRGFRAPHFSLANKSVWMVTLLEESGLTYDSSIVPLSLGEYGHRAPKAPYFITKESLYHEDTIGIVKEIPLSISSFAYLPIPFAGGIYFRILPLWLFKYFLWKESWNTHSPVLYFHPHEFEITTPQITHGPWLRRLLKYWGVKTSFQKFEKMLDWYTFDSIENIYFK